MRHIITNGVAWSVRLSVGLSVTIVSLTERLNRSRCGWDVHSGGPIGIWKHIDATWRIRLTDHVQRRSAAICGITLTTCFILLFGEHDVIIAS